MLKLPENIYLHCSRHEIFNAVPVLVRNSMTCSWPSHDTDNRAFLFSLPYHKCSILPCCLLVASNGAPFPHPDVATKLCWHSPCAHLTSASVDPMSGTHIQVAQGGVSCYEQVENCLSVTVFALKCESHPEARCFAWAQGLSLSYLRKIQFWFSLSLFWGNLWILRSPNNVLYVLLFVDIPKRFHI